MGKRLLMLNIGPSKHAIDNFSTGTVTFRPHSDTPTIGRAKSHIRRDTRIAPSVPPDTLVLVPCKALDYVRRLCVLNMLIAEHFFDGLRAQYSPSSQGATLYVSHKKLREFRSCGAR